MRLAFCLAIALFAAAGSAAANPEVERLLLEGIDDVYRMRFSEGEAANRKAIELDPQDPRGYLGLAAIAWTRFAYEADQSDPALLPIFEKRSDEAEKAALKRLKQDRNDIKAMVALGGALGLKSRLYVGRRQGLSAYWSGRKAVGWMRTAAKIDPKQWDAQLGLGMYDYYSDIYPRLVGALAKIVLGGNRLRGIRTLQQVAENGVFSQNSAKILLVEIYTEDKFGARDPLKALAIVRQLRAKYPDSAMM